MDNVREKINEHSKNRQRKMLIGLIAVIILVVGAILVEQSISASIKDVTIEKNSISEEKAKFIPINQLDTRIIAVKLSDGSYRLAFDDCTGCYSQYGKHGKFRNNEDNTGLICQNCKSELIYEDMGFYTEESMPYPIYLTEIEESEDAFIIPVRYLEKHKKIFEELRKGNAVNSYSENPEK